LLIQFQNKLMTKLSPSDSILEQLFNEII